MERPVQRTRKVHHKGTKINTKLHKENHRTEFRRHEGNKEATRP
jgi:hypothetical protein